MKFDEKYGRQGLAVIGVSMDEDGWKAVRPFLAQKRDPEAGALITMKLTYFSCYIKVSQAG
jgi:hypothetical protein